MEADTSLGHQACLLMAVTRLSRVEKGMLISLIPSFSFSSRCFSNLQQTVRRLLPMSQLSIML